MVPERARDDIGRGDEVVAGGRESTPYRSAGVV
jgi:hypothetical protein